MSVNVPEHYRLLVTTLQNVVETVCEHGEAMDITRLVSFLDLYRQYINDLNLELADSDPAPVQVGFDEFVRSCELLSRAASSATSEYAEFVTAPEPV